MSNWLMRRRYCSCLLICHGRPCKLSAGAHINRTFSKQLGERLRDLAVQEDCTLFMTLLAAFNVVLGRYAGTER